MSKISGSKRLDWIGVAYAKMLESHGESHPEVIRLRRYLHRLVGSCWARRKCYEQGLGNRLPDKPLSGDGDDNF